MIGQPIHRWWYLVLGTISIVLLLAGYTWLSHRQHVRNPADTTIPTWGQLRQGVVEAFTPDRHGERWIVVDSSATARRFFLGLLYGVVGATIIGVLMGCLAPVEALFLPVFTLLAKEPPTAALAIFFVMVGTDMPMYVAMVVFAILPTLAQAICLSIKEVPAELRYKAYTLGASHLEVIWNVIVRYVLPRIFDAVRLQIGIAVICLIAAEMVVGSEGFGYRIRLQSKLLNMNVVYPYLAMLAAFGFAMDYALRLLQRILCSWYIKEAGADQ